VAIVGSTGSGKSALARTLAEAWGIRYVELDALYWQPNWTPAPGEQFQEAVAAAIAGEEWVVDGNHSDVRDLIWRRANVLIWLDYPQSVVLWRLWWRSLRRIAGGAELWNGNRETWRHHVLWRVAQRWLARLRGQRGEDGGEVFPGGEAPAAAFQGHRTRQRYYPRLLAQPAYGHLHVVHLRSPQQTAQWLASLRRAG
jgi:adenylate kinase family enzyme